MSRLLRRSPTGARAFEVARAVTNSWWDQTWPVEERAWPARLEATRPDDADPGWWKAAARDLITYPETVALACLLACRPLQQRTVAASRGHLPYRLGELPALLAELAHELQRPWLAHRLAAVTHGPLFTWAHSCVKTRASSEATAQKALWRVHSAHRPHPLSDLLPQGPTGDGEQQAAADLRAGKTAVTPAGGGGKSAGRDHSAADDVQGPGERGLLGDTLVQPGRLVQQVSARVVHDQVRVDLLPHPVQGLGPQDWPLALVGLDLIEDELDLPSARIQCRKLGGRIPLGGRAGW
ncbi:hypothetical protein GA0115260_1059611 [Streptomyces sp. MnatMP-M27]|nr:hypothetical protein GA0115260_1059611 [Streptomyces sp. MnatMP-M27]